jgi:Tfp pilus assembly protein PilX
MKNNCSKGFIALIPAILLSLILILVAVIMSQSGFLTRQIISESESKERSAALAEACVDNAMILLINNPTYPGSQTIAISGAGTCLIRPILFNSPAPGQNTIETQAKINEATTNLRAVVRTSDSAVMSWDEMVSF